MEGCQAVVDLRGRYAECPGLPFLKDKMHIRPKLTRVPRLQALLFVMFVPFVACPVYAQQRSFFAEGSDSGVGVGARHIALGGAGVALADDVYAAYFNPAGLARVRDVEVSVTRQLNSELRPVNFLGLALPLPLPYAWGFRASLAGVYYPRIHARASGQFFENDFESLFLRYLLPGLSGDFDGVIDTKTKIYRLAFGLTALNSDRWSIGFNVDKIDCKTNFCGVHATSNGFTTVSTGATAISYGVGVRYMPNESFTLGLAASDLGATLDVRSTIVDDNGERQRSDEVAFPQKVIVGAAYQGSGNVAAAVDYEVMRGKYGANDLDFQFIRMGAEIRHGAYFVGRYGMTVPIRLSASNVEDVRAPFPFSPTVGVAWKDKDWSVDLAVYAHPLMSMHKDKPVLTADLGVSLSY